MKILKPKSPLFTTTVAILAVACSGAALAHSDWYNKDDRDSYFIDHALAKLPAKDAAGFRETMQDASDDNKDLQTQLYTLYSDLNTIVMAPDFDKSAFLGKRADIQKIYDKMEDNRAEAFASALAQLTPPERVTLMKTLHDEKVEKHVSHTAHSSHPMKSSSQNTAPTVDDSTDSIKH